MSVNAVTCISYFYIDYSRHQKKSSGHPLDSTVICVMLIYLVNFASGILSPTKDCTATVNFINVTLNVASRIKPSKNRTLWSKIIFLKSKQCVSKMLVCNFSITVFSLSQYLSLKKLETKYLFYYSSIHLEYIDFGFLAVLQHSHFFFPHKGS